MLFLGSTLVMGKVLIIIFPVFILLAIRFLIGFICFASVYLINNNKMNNVKQLSGKDWTLLFLQSFFGAFLFNLFTLLGMKLTSVTSAAIIMSTIPVFIMGLSFLILKEFISKTKWIALIISVLGLILVTVDVGSINTNAGTMTGNFIILLAVISGAFFPICVKLLGDKASPLFMSLTFNFFGLILFAPVALYFISDVPFHLVSLNSWLLVVVYSILANVAYLFLWNRGLAVIPASVASLFTAVMPISATLLAYLFLGETLTSLQAAGMGCILLAITLGIRCF